MMQGPQMQRLVDKCAETASKANNIQAYVIVYQTKGGTLNFHRDGNWAAQVGMLDAVKTGILNGCRE